MAARSALQILAKFVSTPADRFGMQPRDFRNVLKSAMPQPPGLTGRHPATLLLVKTAQQYVQLPMVVSFRRSTRTTFRTTTLMNRLFC